MVDPTGDRSALRPEFSNLKEEDKSVPPQMQSVRNLILRRIDEYLSVKSNTDKWMILEGLVSFCTNFIKDPEIENSVRDLMRGKNLNLNNDFLNMYKDQAKNNSWNIILENEYRKLLPELRSIWFVVEKALVSQGLLPWSFPDPRQELRDKLFRQTLAEIDNYSRPAIPEGLAPEPAPQIVKEDVPPWVDNDFVEPREDRKNKLKELLEAPDLEDAEEEESVFADDPDEELREISEEEIDEAAKIWGDKIRNRSRKELE